MQDTDWRPSPCPTCGEMREAAEHPVCENSSCSSLFKTLKELDVKPGDKVQLVSLGKKNIVIPPPWPIATVKDDLSVYFSDYGNFSYTHDAKFRLVSRAEISHIIVYEGREYDLYKLEMPIEYLKATARPVYDALTAWEHGLEWWLFDGRWAPTTNEFPLFSNTVYRARPAPKKKMIETRSGNCWAELTKSRPELWTLDVYEGANQGMIHGHWTATIEDGKPVEIIWRAVK